MDKLDQAKAKWTELKNDGNKCCAQGKWKEALERYGQVAKDLNVLAEEVGAKQLVSLMKEHPEVVELVCAIFCNRSLAHLKTSQYNKAFRDATQAVKLRPDWPKGFARRAHAAEKLNQNAEALQDWARAAELDPAKFQRPFDQMAEHVLKEVREENEAQIKGLARTKDAIGFQFAVFMWNAFGRDLTADEWKELVGAEDVSAQGFLKIMVSTFSGLLGKPNALKMKVFGDIHTQTRLLRLFMSGVRHEFRTWHRIKRILYEWKGSKVGSTVYSFLDPYYFRGHYPKDADNMFTIEWMNPLHLMPHKPFIDTAEKEIAKEDEILRKARSGEEFTMKFLADRDFPPTAAAHIQLEEGGPLVCLGFGPLMPISMLDTDHLVDLLADILKTHGLSWTAVKAFGVSPHLQCFRQGRHHAFDLKEALWKKTELRKNLQAVDFDDCCNRCTKKLKESGIVGLDEILKKHADYKEKRQKEIMAFFQPFGAEEKEENLLDKCSKCSKNLGSNRLNEGMNFTCYRCFKVAYCSEECQKADYEAHTKVCAPVNESAI